MLKDLGLGRQEKRVSWTITKASEGPGGRGALRVLMITYLCYLVGKGSPTRRLPQGFVGILAGVMEPSLKIFWSFCGQTCSLAQPTKSRTTWPACDSRILPVLSPSHCHKLLFFRWHCRGLPPGAGHQQQGCRRLALEALAVSEPRGWFRVVV